MLAKRGKHAEAEPLLREALHTCREAHPDGDVTTADVILDLAISLHPQQRLATLEPELREAVAILRRGLPGTHAMLRHTLPWLTYLVLGRKDYTEAISLLQEQVEILRAKPVIEPERLLSDLRSLGHAYYCLRDFAKAVPAYEEALTRSTAATGPHSQQSLEIAADLGVNYLLSGRPAESIPPSEAAWRARYEYPNLEWCGINLLDAYIRTATEPQPANRANAVAVANELLASVTERPADEGLYVVQRIAALSSQLLRAQSWSEAEPLLRGVLAFHAAAKPDDWTTFNTRSMLGEALLAQGQLEEAEPLLRTGYQGLKEREAQLPENARERVAEALARLVRLCEAKGERDEAATWQSLLDAERAR
ncbi:MAG: tetratricopeptide repeat protein [Planctomycetes bacterium]|nr:tetratricopeptide repeat protein [Planctomycetota bacterium]